jgi:hypothetical protein
MTYKKSKILCWKSTTHKNNVVLIFTVVSIRPELEELFEKISAEIVSEPRYNNYDEYSEEDLRLAEQIVRSYYVGAPIDTPKCDNCEYRYKCFTEKI